MAPPIVGGGGKKPNPLPERKPAADSGSGIPVAIPAGVAAAVRESRGKGVLRFRWPLTRIDQKRSRRSRN